MGVLFIVIKARGVGNLKIVMRRRRENELDVYPRFITIPSSQSPYKTVSRVLNGGSVEKPIRESLLCKLISQNLK